MKPTYWIILVGCFFSCMGNLQAQSCCDRDSIVTLCYLNSEDYCESNQGGCPGYSLDGIYMKDALKEKLLSADNFGINGKVKCQLELINLPYNPTLPVIKNTGCNVIFLPAVVVNPRNNNVEPFSSFLGNDIFDSIMKWSDECPSNLVIASQGEASKWGYTLVNNNNNSLNFPKNSTSLDRIFDGPFGAIDNFKQGGVYQFTFSRMNAGAEILALNENDKPTILLDTETNDLMLADIGIFCSGQGVGDISEGTAIVTNNDKLACNIFALACEIASGAQRTNLAYEDCEGPIELPDGSFTSEVGIYTDTLLTELKCDSIVNIEIIPCEEVTIPNIFSPNGDGRNDFFNIITEADIKIESFKIFNRWGQVVYNHQTPSFGWDGRFKNIDAPVGVYVYHLVFNNSIGTRRQERSGDITLLR